MESTAAPRDGAFRVVVVDDQRSFAESMAVVVDSQPDMCCVAVARNHDEAVRAAREHEPDVILMDVGLPGVDGVETTAHVMREHPGTRVVVLTGRPDVTVLARAAAAGATAFLLKDSSVEEVLDAIRTSSSTRVQVDSNALTTILDQDDRQRPPGLDELTQRELEVLGELGRGHQPKQIARVLGIALPTCRGYIKTLFQKLGAHSALEAVVLAHRYGLLQPGDD